MRRGLRRAARIAGALTAVGALAGGGTLLAAQAAQAAQTATAAAAPAVVHPNVAGSGIAQLAQANVGDMACSGNSLGGTGYETSCTGNGGSPEYWCADFAEWVWQNSGVADLSGITPAAQSFYAYGQSHGTLSGTPAVGDAVVFSNNQGDTSTDSGGIHHVAIVSSVANGDITTISGDWNGASGSEATFAGSSHVVANAAYGDAVGSYSSVMGMWIEGYIAPPGLTGGSGPRESAVVAPSGTVAVFSIDSHGDLYETNQATPTSTFNAWGEVTTAGNLTGTPAPVVVPSNGTVATFSLTTDGQVEIVGQTASGSTFTNVGIIGSGTHAAFVASPTAVIASNGTVVVFALGSDGYLYETNQTAPGAGFAAWTRIGSGGLTATPSAVLDPNGTIATFNLTTAGGIQIIGQTTPTSNFGSVGGVGSGGPASFAGTPFSLIAPNGTVVVFALGSDDNHYETNQTAIGSAFAAWTRL